MTIKKAIKTLKDHNEWRRDSNVPPNKQMGCPRELGIAIDTAIKVLSAIDPEFVQNLYQMRNAQKDADLSRTNFASRAKARMYESKVDLELEKILTQSIKLEKL